MFFIHSGFKTCRLVAINNALTIQADSPAISRLQDDALLLTAACVWLLNGLRERPDDGPSWRTLMKAVLPTTDKGDPVALAVAFPEPESDSNKLNMESPYYPHGVTFLRRIDLGEGNSAPCMMRGRKFLPPSATEDLFGETKEKIWKRYYPDT